MPACIGPPLDIEPADLPTAIEDEPYSVQLEADADAVRWAVQDGELPPGLQLTEDTGLIAGRPTAPGTYDFTIASQRRGVPSRSGAQFYSLTVLPRLRLTFTPPTGRAGEAYDYTPQISGGVPPYAVEIVGLPAGLDYDRFTGRIFGTPLFAASGLRLDIDVKDNGRPQQQATASAVLVIRPTGVLITTPADLPPAPIGEPYSVQLEATQGRPPYRWLPESGVLPDGLRLNPGTGLISGTPTLTATTETFQISASDFDEPPSRDVREFTIIVPVKIVTASFPPAPAGQAYEQVLSAAGGSGELPYLWTVVEGQPPDGLALRQSGPIWSISGVPTENAVTSTFTLEVVDPTPNGTAARQALKIVVPVAITTQALPGASIGTPYSATVAAAHGLPPYAWALALGQLPAGLQLNTATGEISGTPTAGATTQMFMLLVADSDTPATLDTQVLTIVVTGP